MYMNIKIVYPKVNRKTLARRAALNILRWPFMVAAVVCPIVNLIFGGVWWSLIVVSSLYFIWNLFISIDLIEYNRISQFIKLTIYSCIMMFLIDTFLVSGWALDAISIVSFSSIIISGILLFTDFTRQKQNMLPILLLIIIAIIWCVVGFVTALEIKSWTLIVLGGATLLFLLMIIVVLRGDFFREISCRIHTK